MSNIFGPDPNKGGATIRPNRTTPDHHVDLWFKNCTDPSDTNNTVITTDFLNFLLANMRQAIRGMGVSENESDDDLLLKAIQSVTPELNVTMPLYPEVGNGGLLTVTSVGVGLIEVAAGQTVLHRGLNVYLTSDYSQADRQFTTTANSTYHLRWNPTDGYDLKDLASSDYNSVALDEAAAPFDTTYDDMLCAKVVTDASNNAVVTPLVNKAFLSAKAQGIQAANLSQQNGANTTFQFQINWARSPKTIAVPIQANTNEYMIDIDFELSLLKDDRYQTEVYMKWDFAGQLGVNMIWMQ